MSSIRDIAERLRELDRNIGDGLADLHKQQKQLNNRSNLKYLNASGNAAEGGKAPIRNGLQAASDNLREAIKNVGDAQKYTADYAKWLHTGGHKQSLSFSDWRELESRARRAELGTNVVGGALLNGAVLAVSVAVGVPASLVVASLFAGAFGVKLFTEWSAARARRDNRELAESTWRFLKRANRHVDLPTIRTGQRSLFKVAKDFDSSEPSARTEAQKAVLNYLSQLVGILLFPVTMGGVASTGIGVFGIPLAVALVLHYSDVRPDLALQTFLSRNRHSGPTSLGSSRRAS